MKKRIGAVLMGVLLGTSLIGTNVFATETEPPAESETVFEIVEGATGTYVKGSKKDHVIKVRMSTTAEKIHKVTVDNPENELDRDNWSDGDSEEVPPTTDAPVTSEAPAATTEEDTEDVDDNDEEDTEDESSTTKKDNTTSTKKKTSKKSKSSKTGDNSQIILYLAIALVSGCAIVYFARKKATK